MKKTLIFTLGLFFTMVGLMSCGEGGDDEARQKQIRDSLRNDSIAAAELAAHIADSLMQDSIRIADSLAALENEGTVRNTNNGGSNNTGGSTTTTTEPVKDPVKDEPVNDKTDRDRGGNDSDGPKTKTDRDRGGDTGKTDGDAPKTKSDRKRR